MLCNLNPNLRNDRIQDPIHLKPNGDSIVLLQKIEVKSVTIYIFFHLQNNRVTIRL